MKQWYRGMFAVLLSVAVLLGCGAACAEKPQPERISDEELAILREQYPYNDKNSSLSLSVSYDIFYPNFAYYVTKMQNAGVLAGVAVVEFTGDWYLASNTGVKMYDDEELNQTVPIASRGITWPVIDATVEQVLWGEAVDPESTITIGFGDISVVNQNDLKICFVLGERYVCLLEKRDGSKYGLETPLYCLGKLGSYYLTDQNVLISMVSATAANENSGMYLSAFEALVNETLGEPDAELTPVVPEQERE